MNRIIIIAAAVGIVIIGTAAVVFGYTLFQEMSHQPLETARYLPENTPIYVSINLRPGASQLSLAHETLETLRDNRDIEDFYESMLDDLEDDSDIDLREDVFPWIGPEIALGMADPEDEDSIVGFIGTTDRAAAEDFMDEHGDELFDSGGGDYFLTDNYIVVAADEDFLDDIRDVMDDGAPSLYDSERFQRARDLVDEAAFIFGYLDTEQIGEISQNSGFGQSDDAFAEFLEDNFPEVLAFSGISVDHGFKLTVAADAGGSFWVEGDNPLAVAEYLPEGSIGFVSMTGIAELWELAMDAINSNQEMALGASFVLGMAQASTGIDIEDDVISWMNGEVSLGLIEFEMVPGTFGDEPSFSGIALFQHEDEAAVEDLLDSLASAADEYGIELDEDSVAGQDAIILGAGGMMDVQGIEPAILIHGNYLLLAANADAAEDSIAARDGDTDSLADSDAYRRATEFVSDNLDYAAYVDIAAAVDAYLDMASDFERDDFEENAGPVIEQMESLFIGSTYNEDLVRMEVVVTLKKP